MVTACPGRAAPAIAKVVPGPARKLALRSTTPSVITVDWAKPGDEKERVPHRANSMKNMPKEIGCRVFIKGTPLVQKISRIV